MVNRLGLRTVGTSMRRFFWLVFSIARVFMASLVMPCGSLHAQVSSVSAWDASEFRIWGFVPYWTSTSTLNAFPADGVYTHVSDVLYFGGVRPKIDGSLHTIS